MTMRTITPPRVQLKWGSLEEARASSETMRFMLQAAAGHCDVYERLAPTLKQEKNFEQDCTDFFTAMEAVFASPAGGVPRYIYTPSGKDVVLIEAAPVTTAPPAAAAVMAPPSDGAVHIMLDLETLGTRPGCQVLSIGAAAFGPAGVGSDFKVNLTVEDQSAAGLHASPDTVRWWSERPPEVWEAARYDAKPTAVALGMFSDWVRGLGQRRKIRVWGNGANFDQPVLDAVFAAFDTSKPWEFWNERCHRTLKNLYKHVEAPSAPVVAHDALHDARAQADHAARILNTANLWATV